LSVLESAPRRSSQLRVKLRRAVSLVGAVAVLVGASSGCGGGEGVESGATVAAYVEAPLCSGAKKELARQGGEAGDVKVQAVCLPSPRKGGKLDLATLGANARRATEDSTAVAYLEAPDPSASRFTHPILETAEIPWIASSSGQKAMAQLLKLIPEADSGSLRHSLQDKLNEP
jgi:hypothetical protein